jgi:hypothetical protein
MFCKVNGTKTKCGCWVCEDVQRIRDDPSWATELGLEPIVVKSLLQMSIEQLHQKRAAADEREREAERRVKWTAARQRSMQRLVRLNDDELARQKKVRTERNARYHARRKQRSSPDA